MQVPDAAAFVADPRSNRAMVEGVAIVAGVDPEAVWVELSLENTRRRLQAGTPRVKVDYTIDVDGAQATQISNLISAQTPATMAQTLTEELAKVGVVVVITVRSILPPTVEVIELSTEGNSEIEEEDYGIEDGVMPAASKATCAFITLGVLLFSMFML